MKTAKVLVGLGTGVFTYYYFNSNNYKTYNSWTTNYEPPAHAKWDFNWDHRSPKAIIKPDHHHRHKRITEIDDNKINESIEQHKPKAVRHLILIRHGQYNLNGKTDEERSLTDMGKLQADYTGKRLQDLGIQYTDLVISTMTRAQETGFIISSSLPKVPTTDCSLIREGAPIPPEPPHGRWKAESYFFTDGARIEAAFRKYFYRAEPEQLKDSYTILVCHANVIRYFVCRALQFPPEAWLRLSLNHASITWISITPSGRVILRALGDSGHIPVNYVTVQ